MEVVRDMGQPLPPLSNLRVRMRPPQTSCIRAFVLKCVSNVLKCFSNVCSRAFAGRGRAGGAGRSRGSRGAMVND